MHFEHPYFVTPHAVDVWRRRIAVKDSPVQAIAHIQEALQLPLFERPGRDGARIYGCRLLHDGRDIQFGAVVRDNPEREWLAVVTVGEWWRWHEFRRLWPRRVPRYRSLQAVQAKHYRPQSAETPRAGKRWTYDEEDYVIRAITHCTPLTIARRLAKERGHGDHRVRATAGLPGALHGAADGAVGGDLSAA